LSHSVLCRRTSRYVSVTSRYFSPTWGNSPDLSQNLTPEVRTFPERFRPLTDNYVQIDRKHPIWQQIGQNPVLAQIPDLGSFDIIISLPSPETGVKCLYRYRKIPHLGGFNQPLIRRGVPKPGFWDPPHFWPQAGSDRSPGSHPQIWYAQRAVGECWTVATFRQKTFPKESFGEFPDYMVIGRSGEAFFP